ncbi:hypothetical protein YC2023_001656 [Brassica napus]
MRCYGKMKGISESFVGKMKRKPEEEKTQFRFVFQHATHLRGGERMCKFFFIRETKNPIRLNIFDLDDFLDDLHFSRLTTYTSVVQTTSNISDDSDDLLGLYSRHSCPLAATPYPYKSQDDHAHHKDDGYEISAFTISIVLTVLYNV